MAEIPLNESGGYHGDPVWVECCRKCKSRYQFKLESGEIITVLCGRPIDQVYKAVSYLWETTLDLPLKCRHCSVVTTIPMRDAKKLWHLMNLARGGSIIWLDALSIDQSDETDKAVQLMVMGDIYRNAQVVSVLLPRSDGEAYTKLKQLATTADAIVQRSAAFGMSPIPEPGSIAAEPSEALRTLADAYHAQMRDWIANIHRWRYWRRAWTFQEWAMASEIEMSLEPSAATAAADTARGSRESLVHIKNVIVMASTITGHWRKTGALLGATTNLSGPERLQQQLRLREEVGQDLNAVRAHFPFEDFLVADSGEDQDVLRRSTFLPSMPTATDSGTYVHIPSLSPSPLPASSVSRPTVSPSSSNPVATTAIPPPRPLLPTLTLALNALATSAREASSPADLIACWASMCNIAYGYRRGDSFEAALHKVVSALRRAPYGVCVYNFLANTDLGETDLRFLDYAAAMRVGNWGFAGGEEGGGDGGEGDGEGGRGGNGRGWRKGGYLLGTPVFVGRADTVRHVELSLEVKRDDGLRGGGGGRGEKGVEREGGVAHLEGYFNVSLMQVDKVIIKRPIPWSDRTKVLAAFRALLSGKADGVRLVDVGDVVEKLIAGMPTAQLEKFLFVTASITVADVQKMWYFNVWGICPSEIVLSDLFVARESLNGTLVLAVYKGPRSKNKPAKEAQIVSYLNMTHQQDGTYLVKANEVGIVDVVFRTVDTPPHELFGLPELDLGVLGGGASLLPDWNILDVVSDRELDVQISFGERRFSLASIKGGTKM